MLLLYPVAGAIDEIARTDLHSIMLLLYLIDGGCRRFLCFHLHSIMLLLYLLSKFTLSTKDLKFTFHYASTLSVCVTDSYEIPIKFTFHYASTLSKVDGKFWTAPLNLHSIMLLLYLQPPKQMPALPRIYIPLCFYFIPFLFSPLISCSSDLYFVHLLFSLYFHFKNILVKSPKCNFTLAVRALSTYWKFYTISSRQLEKVARFIIIHTPELFRNPLFISAFKNN